MRTCIAKWLFGCAAFVSPAVVAVIGQKLDHSPFRQDPTYKSLIPVFVWGSLALSALVPAILVMAARASAWRRVGCLMGIWFLLLVELYWTFFVVLMTQ